MNQTEKTIAAFIMPVYIRHNDPGCIEYLKEAIESVIKQNDTEWHLIIVDDFSSEKATDSIYNQYKDKFKNQITIIKNMANRGPGASRNEGINYAFEKGFPFVLFIDSDDISHQDRLKCVRNTFENNPDANVVYTTFRVIDEYGKCVDWNSITPSVREILEAHKNPPPQSNTWINICTETGYISLTSATAVRTKIAKKYLFPTERVSEDANTWMRYSADGGKFIFTPECPSLYRIPQNTLGSSSRSREGKKNFYESVARVNYQGFCDALIIAEKNENLLNFDIDELKVAFFIRLAETLLKEDQYEIAEKQIEHARRISNELTDKILNERYTKSQYLGREIIKDRQDFSIQ